MGEESGVVLQVVVSVTEIVVVLGGDGDGFSSDDSGGVVQRQR